MQNKHQRRAINMMNRTYLRTGYIVTFVLLKQISVTKHSIPFVSV